MKNKKLVSSVIAVVLAVGILFGGTFAWQSISQQALNEVYGFVNPGGRLHDDFHEVTDVTKDTTRQFDKNVYVENFTTLVEDGVQVFARVRLDEYMEVGPNAGQEGADNEATSLVYGAELTNKSTWATYKFGDTDSVFRQYWTWDFEGATTYMPTFNKNKDSLQADVNGTFDAGFTDYMPYELGDSKDGTAVYDKDDNTVDEIVTGPYTVEQAAQNGFVSTAPENHTAKATPEGYVISMQTWIDGGSQPGNFWVYDVDGWAYWANPIDPDSATGLLLDGIARTDAIINENWYYGINVVAQFVTSDDLGKDDGTGFYDTNAGSVPTTNALKLLAAIGVDVDTTVSGTSATAAADLAAALELGGNVTIKDTVTSVESVEFANIEADFVWCSGGTLTGGAINATGDGYAGLVINNENNWPKTGDGAKEATMSGTTIQSNTAFGVYIQPIDAPVTVNDATLIGTNGGLLVEYGGLATLNNVKITAESNYSAQGYEWVNSAVAAANGASVVINGGEYSGKYAVCVFSSGGTITINDGIFTGELRADAGAIIIKGGTFKCDPSEFLAEGYTATKNEGNWVVTAQ